MTGKRRKGGRPLGETLGGIIVGFDQQIMRTLPPPHELVLKGSPVRGVSGDDGGSLEITFPPDVTPGPEVPSTDGESRAADDVDDADDPA